MNLSAQEFSFPKEEKLVRGDSFITSLKITTTTPITITDIKVEDDHGFTTEILDKTEKPFPLIVQTTEQIRIKVTKDFFTKSGTIGPDAGLNDIQFNINYKIGDLPASGAAILKFKYTTHPVIFFSLGFLGLMLGYIVKSLIAKPNEKNLDGTPNEAVIKESFLRYAFTRNWSKLIILMILGIAVLLFSYRNSEQVFGWVTSILLGLGTGILGDESLLQKIGAMKG